MKYIKFLFVGILFGITMVKSEAVSWYRIYEMFRFESFHMYGIIGTAVILGVILVALMKRSGMTSMDNEPLCLNDKDKTWPRYIIGGTIFGLGWALAGACPGPMFVLFGAGVYSILLVIIGAVFGTYVYGLLRDKLPH